MTQYFLDTSALIKHYHTEVGTPQIEALLAAHPGTFTISRLTIVELHAAFAKKVRMGLISVTDFEKITRRFRSDVAAKRWRVIRLLVAHYQLAERLIRKSGLVHNLRTLDALQLSVAMSLNDPADPVTLVSADKNLIAIATGEGLSVINPEVP
jgi:predicted nucleic acid-binding protein